MFSFQPPFPVKKKNRKGDKTIPKTLHLITTHFDIKSSTSKKNKQQSPRSSLILKSHLQQLLVHTIFSNEKCPTLESKSREIQKKQFRAFMPIHIYSEVTDPTSKRSHRGYFHSIWFTAIRNKKTSHRRNQKRSRITQIFSRSQAN